MSVSTSGVPLLPRGCPKVVRYLKDITLEHERLGNSIVLVSHALDVPAELGRVCAKFNLRLPSGEEPCVLWMDEIFFVDLPDAAEEFTGAEIEESIVSARYLASSRRDGGRGPDVTETDVLAAGPHGARPSPPACGVRPASVVMAATGARRGPRG